MRVLFGHNKGQGGHLLGGHGAGGSAAPTPVDVAENGGFDDTSWWGTDASWTIAAGVATVTGNDQLYSPQNILKAGKTYDIIFDVTNVVTPGNLVVVTNLNNFVSVLSTGEYSVIGASPSIDGRLRFGAGSGSFFRGSIDNVQILEY